jgi:hypothetical protein
MAVFATDFRLSVKAETFGRGGMMTLPLGLVLALTLMTQDERPHMSIVLCDQIGIDALAWSTAKTQATRVF